MSSCNVWVKIIPDEQNSMCKVHRQARDGNGTSIYPELQRHWVSGIEESVVGKTLYVLIRILDDTALGMRELGNLIIHILYMYICQKTTPQSTKFLSPQMFLLTLPVTSLPSVDNNCSIVFCHWLILPVA